MVATYNANAVTHTAASAASALPSRSNTYTSAVPVSAVPTTAFPPLNTNNSIEGTSTHAILALYRHTPGRYLCRSAADTGTGEAPSSRGDPSPAVRLHRSGRSHLDAPISDGPRVAIAKVAAVGEHGLKGVSVKPTGVDRVLR
jgi:hypothetical protein